MVHSTSVISSNSESSYMEMHCANYYRAEKRLQISKLFLGFNDSGISEGKRISNDILLAQRISFFSIPAGAQSNGLLIPFISISMCSQSFLCELSVVLIFVLLLCYLISAPAYSTQIRSQTPRFPRINLCKHRCDILFSNLVIKRFVDS